MKKFASRDIWHWELCLAMCNDSEQVWLTNFGAQSAHPAGERMASLDEPLCDGWLVAKCCPSSLNEVNTQSLMKRAPTQQSTKPVTSLSAQAIGICQSAKLLTRQWASHENWLHQSQWNPTINKNLYKAQNGFLWWSDQQFGINVGMPNPDNHVLVTSDH